MYRSSLTLAFVVLYSAAGAASDLSPVYVAPAKSTRHQLMSMCVRHRPIGNRLTRSAVTDIGSPLTRRRALHIVHRHRSMASTVRPRSRYMSNARRSIPSVTTLRSDTTQASYAPDRYYGQERDYAGERDYASEYAPRPPLPVPYRSRARCDDGYGRWVSCD